MQYENASCQLVTKNAINGILETLLLRLAACPSSVDCLYEYIPKLWSKKRSLSINVTNLKRVRRRSLTRMRKQNTTLKSHIRLTIVSFNKLCIILDILRGEGKFLCPTCNSFASSYSSLSPRAMWEFRGWWWFL